VEQAGACFVMERRVKTCRTILAAVAVAAFAGNASLAQHGGGKSAPHGAVHHQSSAPGASEVGTNPAAKIAPSPTGEIEKSAGRSSLPATFNSGANKKGGEGGNEAGFKPSVAKTGAAVQGIDLVRPDGGNANLRRRAMRSSLIANAAKKVPTIVAPGNIVVHPQISSPAVVAKNAIGVSAPSTGSQNLTVAHTATSIAVNRNATDGNVAKTSIGGNVSDIRHENPHPVPMAGAIYSTGLSGSAMGHSAVNPAPLGGPAHIVSGIGGASIRPRY
jgi:hypothetical protein